MVPLAYSERRHRMNPDEVPAGHIGTHMLLQHLLKIREPGTLDLAQSCYRLWFRIHNHVHNKPAYGPHETWDEIAAQIPNGTISLEEAGA